MPSPTHDFMFDVNFSFGQESVFTVINQDMAPPFPPSLGYLLETDNTPILLTTGERLSLA